MTVTWIIWLRRCVYGGLAALTLLAVVTHPSSATVADALVLNTEKIAPSVLARMQAAPLQRIPIILEMNPATAPFPSGVNAALAQQAVTILGLHGQVFGGLPIVNGAAGYANAAEIQAISRCCKSHCPPGRADRSARPSTTAPHPAAPLSSLPTREVRADRAWTRGLSGRGVTVAVLDSAWRQIVI